MTGEPVRAPADATGWTPGLGWLYEPDEASAAVERGEIVLVVGDDGYVHGLVEHEPAQPIRSAMRVDGDVVDVVTRLDELAETVATLGGETRARLTALAHRVTALEDRVTGQDTGNAVEIAALKQRVRRLEQAAG